MIELHFDAALIERQMERLKKVPYAVQKALYPAVAEVMTIAREDLARQIKSDVPLAPKLIEKSIKMTTPRISGQGVEGLLTVASKALPLINYDVEPATVTARKGMRSKQWPGFSYALRTGERRSREQLEGLEHMKGLPFIAQMPGGHLGVYRRTFAGQLKELYGPRMQYHATTPAMEAMLIARAEENFSRILPRIVDRVLTEAAT